MRVRSGFIAAVMTGAVVNARAALPDYDPPQLQCRANFSGAFNLPNTTFFSNATPSLNDIGQVAVRLDIVAGEDRDGAWFGENGAGSVVFTSVLEAIWSDVSLNDIGRIVVPQSFSSFDGIYFHDTGSGVNGLLTTLPLGASGWSAVTINHTGDVGFRAIFTGRNAWAVFDEGPDTAAVRAVEATLMPSSPYSFLFTPAFNNAGQIAGKARLGGPNQTGESQPDQIIVIDPDGTAHIIAQDADGLPGSQFLRFDNSVDINDHGQVVFQATLAGNVRGVFRSDGMTTTEIARTGQGGLTDLEFFRPAMNNDGQVVFRGFSAQGRAIWIGDGTDLRPLVREHDIVPTDLGDARIDQHDSGPVFGGGPDINTRGDIAFQCGLTPPDNNQIEWGSGLFIVHARQGLTGDMNCDGVVTVADIGGFVLALTDPAGYAKQFPSCSIENADLNGDSVVTVADIGPFVALLIGG